MSDMSRSIMIPNLKKKIWKERTTVFSTPNSQVQNDIEEEDKSDSDLDSELEYKREANLPIGEEIEIDVEESVKNCAVEKLNQ